ncbi:hypothetical protein Q1695_009805 [Nippostrongylus brasiliensis]|nr:hypothetical protein Q1695_009805 [Nippostrongylus brasiliensis]
MRSCVIDSHYDYRLLTYACLAFTSVCLIIINCFLLFHRTPTISQKGSPEKIASHPLETLEVGESGQKHN